MTGNELRGPTWLTGALTIPSIYRSLILFRPSPFIMTFSPRRLINMQLITRRHGVYGTLTHAFAWSTHDVAAAHIELLDVAAVFAVASFVVAGLFGADVAAVVG